MSLNYDHFHADYFSVSASNVGTGKCEIEIKKGIKLITRKTKNVTFFDKLEF